MKRKFNGSSGSPTQKRKLNKEKKVSYWVDEDESEDDDEETFSSTALSQLFKKEVKAFSKDENKGKEGRPSVITLSRFFFGENNKKTFVFFFDTKANVLCKVRHT